MTPPNLHRRGFRLRGNTLFLLFIFFLIGLFLHYNGQTKPVVAFWNDVKQLLGLKTGPPGRDREDEEANPYKAPEPNADNEATADGSSSDRAKRKRRQSPDDEASATGTDSPPNASQSGNARFAFEKQVDFILPAHDADDEIVRHEGYTLRFRDEYKVADWVAYPLLAYEVIGDASRKNEPFKPDPDVSTGSALPTDYTRSGYDRGHLAPAADFKFSQRMMGESFYMSNMTPQAPQFNRGIWSELESLVRTWAVRDNGLYVITGPVLKPGLPTIGKTNDIAVPEQFYKVILYCNSPEVRMIGFLLNNEGSNRPLTDFVVPVDQIERVSGIDFFPKLPDDIEQKLESRPPGAAVNDWFR